MLVPLALGTLVESRVRIQGRIVSATNGASLARTVRLYDHNRNLVAEAMSDAAGTVEFDLNASLTDVFIAHAVAGPGECDAISGRLNGLSE